MKKTSELDNFLEQYDEVNLTQFSIDVIEDWQDRIEECQREPYIAEADFLHALHYEVDNIIEIIRRDLIVDCAFFHKLSLMLQRLAGKADAQTRHERRVSKANLN